MIQSVFTSFLRKVHPAEVFIAIAVLAGVNYLYYPDNPGFLATLYNPYFIVILLFSSFYGKMTGIVTFFLAMLGMIATSIMVYTVYYKKEFLLHDIFSLAWIDSFVIFLFISFLFSIIFGEIRDTLGGIIQKLKKTNLDYLKRNTKLQNEIGAISLVNEEYQDRILGQQNSLVSLYSIMISLNSLDLKGIYPNILQAVVKFSGAIKCSIWRYEQKDRVLRLLSTHGWDEAEKNAYMELSDSDTINGWVARNNVLFSIKMLTKYKNLREIDNKRNILTVPITIENRVWGVLNIEEMPFIKYNLYSEQLVLMISDLAAPVIANAIRFTKLTKRGEIDPITGFHSLDEFFIVMKDEFDKSKNSNLVFSIIILEMTNYNVLLEQYSEDEVLELLKSISQQILQISFGKALIFQYKETFQFAAILPNMDHDGAAMFCLSVIEAHYNKQFTIKGEKVTPEIILGYSSMRPNHRSEEDIMLLAENLLMMQKI